MTMPVFHSRFLRSIHARGYIHQATDLEGLDRLLAEAEAKGQPVAGYIGFDCTATSLHVGSLMQIMLLRHWQQAGHKPIVLMGGGTTKVGDPSGKDEARKLLDDAAIASNMAGIKRVFDQYLSFGDGPGDAVMVNNADWLDGLQYIRFLRDYGRHFSVNRMMSMDSVKLRLEREQNLSFLEFNYMILQAYDFVELHQRHQVRVQFGGSDQWGNIIQGVELERRVMAEKGPAEGHGLFGLTTPLLTTASGAKMGKTAQGAVWLEGEMFSAYDFWQFWRNVDDADVERFLLLFTEDSPENIRGLLQGNINEAKKHLATRVTALCHGEAAAQTAAEAARALFEQGGVSENMPSIDLAAGELAATPLAQLLVFSGMAESLSDARRAITKDRCVKVNDQLALDPARQFSEDDFGADMKLKLSRGKKQHRLVKLI
jgi:tyrosyl-tRNA synthetase